MRRLNTETTDFGGVLFIAGHPDHPNHFAFKQSDPEVVALIVEVGFVQMLNVRPGIVGRNLPGEQTFIVQTMHVGAIDILIGADAEAFDIAGWLMF